MRWLDADSFVTLQRVHPVLSATFLSAYGRWRVLKADRLQMDIRVTEGFRTRARQQSLLIAGKSWTQESAHLDGLAVDVAFLSVDRKTAHWDFGLYEEFDEFMQAAFGPFRQWADGSMLIWGGGWKQRDAVHWELHGFHPTMVRA